MRDFLKAPICRTAAQVLVFLMVIQGWPLWELSRSYELSPVKFRQNMSRVIHFLGPEEAHAGSIFGPKKYVRTTGKPNVYNDSFSATPGKASLIILNGEQNGQNRVSSAIITLNGKQIAGTSDFNQNVYRLSRAVDLSSKNNLVVELRSNPGSYLQIEITPLLANQPPVANAGPDQTLTLPHGQTMINVQLNGSGSFDADGTITGYTWTGTPDPADVVNPTISLTAGVYTFTLLVTDDKGQASALDTVTITVLPPPNQPPVANAGADQNVTVGDLVTLDGRNSYDPDKDLITYAWQIIKEPSGSHVSLNNPNSVMPTFTPDQPGNYVVSLTINDGQVNSAPDEVTVVAARPNVPPTADAGPDQSVVTGSIVHLDGRHSFDPEGSALIYKWQFTSKPPGSTAVLDNRASATPSFVADKDGQYDIGLIVNDGKLDSLADDVLVTSATPNAPPVAYAGKDQVVPINSVITLDGTGSSDPNNDPLTYSWSIVSRPNGSVSNFDDSHSSEPKILADRGGEYVFSLVVSDGQLTSAPDTVVVMANQAPVVNAGADQIITLPASANLAGTVSDDGLPAPANLTYGWSKVSGPGTVTFGNASALSTTASFSMSGVYVLRLTATDGILSASDDVQITVNPAPPVNQAPKVNAGSNQSITLPANANLSGSATDDGLPNPPGALTYAWSKVSGPGTVTFGNAAAPSTTASFSVAGTYLLRLTAYDGALSGTSDVTIVVNDSTLQLAAVPDGTINLGSRFQQVLQASSSSGNAALTYTLPTAPAGAALNPPPLVDWLPTVAQVGTNNFTARVTDGQGHSATTSFQVTVVHVNHPPQLVPQGDVTMDIGTTFTRTLIATDPDAGDVLTYSLVSGPAGMTLTGTNLNWPTTGQTIGNYTVTVKVTDSGGLFDVKQFTLSLRQAVAPLANDDNYEVKLGQTLTVTAPGVLGNDIDPMGGSLTAAKLTDPDKGTLSAFNTDGSFTYQVPAVIGNTFQPVVKWISHTGIAGDSSWANLRTVDVDGDGKPEIIVERSGGAAYGTSRLSVIHGTDGSTLWTSGIFLPAAPPNDQCMIITGIMTEELAVGDIDDSGAPAIIVPVQCPDDSSALGLTERLAALDARTGAFKWLSPKLSPAFSNGDYPMTYGVTPAIARLRPTESPSVLFKRTVLGSDNTGKYYCDPFQTGLTYCIVVMALDGTTGTLRQQWVAPTDNSPVEYGGRESYGHVIVADLTGSGSPSIIAGSAVWDINGNLINNRVNGRGVLSLALANLDDSGQTAIISYELEFGVNGTIVARKPDGTVLWESPTDPSYVHGHLVVADLFGDGRPKIMASTDGNLYVYDEHGALVWTHRFADINNTPTIEYFSGPVVFDLDGDGVPELIMQTAYGVEFFDGKTGAVKAKVSYADMGYPQTFPYQSYSSRLTPLVIDVDGNGHTDVVFNILPPYYPLDSWVVALKAQDDDWQPARPVWNQYAMHDANVADNGHIPQVEVNNFAVPRTNVFANPARIAPPVDPRKREQATFTYQATAGGLTSNPATVTIDIVPPNRPPVFTSTPPTTYMPFYASSPSNPYIPFVYQAHATDPDPGDTVTYSIVVRGGSESACFIIGASTGKVECSGGILYGGSVDPTKWETERLVIAATDSFGASTYQTITLKPSAGFATVPNVVGMSKTAAGAALTAAGFTTGTINAIYNPAPVDQVLTQYPFAGASLLAGEAVALQISQGLQPQPVPDLIGFSLADARARLLGFGFTVNINPVASPTAPANMVLAQNPAFGTMLAPGNQVTLDVSIGPPLSGTVAQVIVEPAPSATRLVGETLNYRATAVFTDGTSRDVTIASLWNSLPSAVASVDNTGVAKGLTSGTTTISATVSGVTGQSTLNIVTRVTGDAVTPVALITAPTDGTSITGPVTVTGTASDANFLRYELAYALAGDTTWTTVAEGTSPVSSGTLGTFDATTLLNDLYTLRLAVFDRNGNETDATVTVQVLGNAKPGLFTLTYQDLNIPMTGIPITVLRTYDSRDKGQGDFGVGWRQGFNTLRLRTNRVPGTGWVRNIGGFGVVSLVPTSEHKVSVTLPDGKVEEFDMAVFPTSNLGGLDATAVTGYTPRPGTLGQLQALGNLSLLIVNGGAEDQLIDDITFNTFNPKQYRYTTADDTQIDIDITDGVKKITDRNGNNVTFGPNGIIHSAGKSVIFTRDGQGRITQITDPMGNVQTYTYDINGDLASRTSATGDESHYRYDRNHNIIDIQDPAGNHAARNTYDASGHLIATTDANGHTITLTIDLAASRSVVTDRLGNPTIYDYDAMGNVITKTDALGHVTTNTYDSRNNQLTQTDPLGRVASRTYDSNNNVLTSTDFEGNTAVFTYDARSFLLTRTDPEGHITTNIYDANNNLTQVTDPEGGITRHTYDGSGRRLSTTDPLGNVTTFTYDAAGNRTSQTDPFGRTTTYTYDANSHDLGQRDPDGKTTLRAYDAAGRIVSVTDKLGNVTLISYSNIGDGQKIATRTDPRGGVTRLDYDSIGNLTTTTFPDGSVESTTYDLENHVLSKTDRDGDTTSFQYDALGRQTKTTYPDGAATLTTYDAAGRLATQTDERGNTTTYAYAPNQQTITDALGKVTVHLFDSQRRNTKTTDALGHDTSFAFDSAGNPTRTTFPDASFKTVTYDAAKRKTAETDQAGQSTQFAYDAAGNLLRVTNAASGVTSYTYDAVGNRLTQTDANGHTTQMSYDALGQTVARTLPSGKQESFVYDAVGNQVSHTDFNGQTTTFVYDVQNRLTQKALPERTTVTYAYTGTGLRTEAGGDSYAYDKRARLLQDRKVSGETLTYTYDAAGNKTSVTTLQGTTTYTYDTLNRLATVADTAGTTLYSYDAVGNLASMAYPNGITTTYTYDTLNRLVKVTNTGPGGLISSYTYTLGPAGNRVQVAEAGSATTARTVTYAFDAVYRLTQELIAQPGNPDVTIGYTYDAVGNRTQMDRNGTVTTYTYDTSDRLITEVRGASMVTSSYDDNGNLTSRSDGVNTDSYAYDAENRLVSASAASGVVAYTYDADGMRTSKTAGGLTTTYLVDKTPEDARVLVEKFGVTQATYTYGHQLIGQARPGQGVHFYLADGQVSTRQLTDTLGVVSDSYTYDAFGVQSQATGSTTNAYLYTGEQFDPNLSLYYLRARYYSQAAGRFVSTDPHEGDAFEPISLHRYLYANADPVDKRDPSGNASIAEVMVSIGISALIGGVGSAVVAYAYKRSLGQPVGFTDVLQAFVAGAFIVGGGAALGAAGTAAALSLGASASTATFGGLSLGATATAVLNTTNTLLLIHKNRDVTVDDVNSQLILNLLVAGVQVSGAIAAANSASGGTIGAGMARTGANRTIGTGGRGTLNIVNQETGYGDQGHTSHEGSIVVWRQKDGCPGSVYSKHASGAYGDPVGKVPGTGCNLLGLVVQDLVRLSFIRGTRPWD